MISRIRVKNFQSLRDLDLDLGKFTVIVGASSSGKSAFLRAIRLVVSNARGTTYVTRGEKATAVSLTTRGHTVTVSRGEGLSAYKVDDDTYTKCGTTVPEVVSKALGLSPDGGPNFAGQFDRPYLLDESGAGVARVLGDLTNVSLIFDAAREANRKRLAAASELKTREVDLTRLKEQAVGFKGLPKAIKAIDRAERTLGEATNVSGEIRVLTGLRDTLAVAEAAVATTTTVLDQPVPDTEAIESAHDRLTTFQTLVSVYHDAQLKAAGWATKEYRYEDDENVLHQRIHDLLVDAGECPTCGSVITE